MTDVCTAPFLNRHLSLYLSLGQRELKKSVVVRYFPTDFFLLIFSVISFYFYFMLFHFLPPVQSAAVVVLA